MTLIISSFFWPHHNSLTLEGQFMPSSHPCHLKITCRGIGEALMQFKCLLSMLFTMWMTNFTFNRLVMFAVCLEGQKLHNYCFNLDCYLCVPLFMEKLILSAKKCYQGYGGEQLLLKSSFTNCISTSRSHLRSTYRIYLTKKNRKSSWYQWQE